VRTGDRATDFGRERPPLPVTLVLDRLRSAFNVGNIYRLADAVGAANIIACGYTPRPPHPKLDKTARGCQELIATRHFQSAREAIQYLHDGGVTVYGIETADGAVPVWELPVRFPAAFVFGNEALGVDPEALARCDALGELPCRGFKNSINVGNCAAVVLYEALRRWRTNSQDDCKRS